MVRAQGQPDDRAALARALAGDVAAIAVAVVLVARQDAARGDVGAQAWLEQLRADILDDAPPHLARRWANNPSPGTGCCPGASRGGPQGR